MARTAGLAAQITAIALLAFACGQPDASPVISTTIAPVATTGALPTTTTSTTTTTTTIATTTTTEATVTTTVEEIGPGPDGAEVFLPALTLGAPVAVLVHGGGWVTGHPGSIEHLGRALADPGMMVVNASYRTLSSGGGYPATFDDVACAIRYARTRAAEVGASDELTVMGHSAGAHLAAAVALSNEAFGGDCPWDGTATPDRLVGLAGIYQIDAVEPVMELLLGGSREAVPEAWANADPFQHLAAAADMAVTLIHGESDGIVPASASSELAAALEALGVDVTLALVPGATHMDMLDPEVVADLIMP